MSEAQLSGGSSNPTVNPEVTPDDKGGSKEDQKPGTETPAGPQDSAADSSEDCAKNEDLGSVDIEFPLSAFPFEPGIAGGRLWLYIVKPDAVSMAALSRLKYHSVATMHIESSEILASGELSFRCVIEQASGLAITFEIPRGQTIGLPVGQQGSSEARIELLNAQGAVTEVPGSAVKVRQYRAAGGTVVYDLASGQALEHTTRTGRVVSLPDTSRVEVIKVNNLIRQVRTEAGLLDVVSVSATQYTVSTYMPGQYGAKAGNPALFAVAGKQPSRSVNVTASGVNSLIVTVKEFSRNAANADTTLTTVKQYDYLPAVADWSLTIKNAGTPVLKQTRIFESLPDHPDGQVRKITRVFANGSNVELYRSSIIQKKTPWGAWVNGDIEEKAGAAGVETIKRLQQYGTDPDAPGYKQLAYQKNADGVLFRYGYDQEGRMVRREQPWLDNTKGTLLLDAYSYEPVHPLDSPRPGDARPRTTTQLVGKAILSRNFLADYNDPANANRYTQIEEQAAHAGAIFGTPENRRKITVYYGPTDPAFTVGRVLEIKQSEGTAIRYEYQLDTTTAFDPLLTTTEIAPLTSDGQVIPGRTARVKIVSDAQGRIRSERFGSSQGDQFLDYRLVTHTYHAEGQLHQITETDLLSNQSRIREVNYWQGPRLASQIDGMGLLTTFGYDVYGVQNSSVRTLRAAQASPLSAGHNYPSQPVVTTTTQGVAGTSTCDMTGIPWNRETVITTTSGSLTVTRRITRDMRRRISSETDEAGYVTSYSYSDDCLEVIKTLPSGALVKTVSYRDGRLKEISGNGTVARYYKYSTRAEGGLITVEHSAASDGPRYTQVTTDMLGRETRIVRPAFGGGEQVISSFYDGGTDRVARITHTGANGPLGPTQLFAYDASGLLEYQASSVRPGATAMEFNSTDRIIRTTDITVTEVENGQTKLWEVSERFVYPLLGASAATAVRVESSKRMLAGFTGDQIIRTKQIDIRTNVTEEIVTLSTATGLGTKQKIIPGSSASHWQIRHWDRPVEERFPGANASVLTRTDALGRAAAVKDPRHGTYETTTQYLPSSSLISSVTDAAGNATTYTYVPQGTFGASMVATETTPAGVKRFLYTARGEVEKEWGASTNPISYVYDEYGQKLTMSTFRRPVADGLWLNSSTWPLAAFAADTTTWIHDPATGLLTVKQSADQAETAFEYYSNGQLWRRTWARGVVTTFEYTAFGDMDTVSYSDGRTPQIDWEYDRLGRPDLVREGTGGSLVEHDFEYDPATLDLTRESRSVFGSLRWVERNTDALGRLEHLRVKDGTGAIEHEVSYSYEPVGGGLHTVSRTTPGLTTKTFTYSYHPANTDLIQSITGPAHTVVNTWEPRRDLLDIKENRRLNNSVFSRFDYTVNNSRLRTQRATTGDAFSQANTLTWIYDGIGQLKTELNSPSSTKDRSFSYDAIGNRITGGASSGPMGYQANSINQYANLTPPGAQTPVMPAFDADGNLTADAAQNAANVDLRYVWDGENRLIEIRRLSDDVLLAKYHYDYRGRRVGKETSSAAAQGTSTLRYIYDGWSLLGEYTDNSGPSLKLAYVWGSDLSRRLQGAGDVGGLLVVSDSIQNEGYYAAYDGNGNVTEYLDDSGTVVAHYEYDAFGEIVSASGNLASKFAHRFATKAYDPESGASYFGYRYYSPRTGRWLSRDPIEERGGENLYGFIGNDAINSFDALGLVGYYPPAPKGDGSGSFSISFPELSFATGQSVNFKGCMPIGGPFFLCLAGGWEIRVGNCCKGKTKKGYFQMTADVTLTFEVFGVKPFSVSYRKQMVENLARCPGEGGSLSWHAIFSARVGPLHGQCRYSKAIFGADAGGRLVCTGSLSFTHFDKWGGNISGGGGLRGTYTKLDGTHW